MSKQSFSSVPRSEIHEFFPKKTNYCLCIPIINEGERFKKELAELREYSKLIDIIILDKGSTDGSTELGFLKKNNVKALLVLKEAGKQGSQLRMGFNYAFKKGYEGIITIDGNGKDDSSSIPAFVKALDDGYDFVQGSRFIKGGKGINTPRERFFAIRCIHAPFQSLAARHWYTDTTNGFRAYSKKYLADPRVNPLRNIFVSYELMFYLTSRANQLGFRTKEIPVTRSYPKNQTPTKIKGFKNNFNIVLTLLRILFGYYNP